MAVRTPGNNELTRRRIKIVFLLVLLCYLLLIVKLLFLQGVQGTALREEARNQRLRETPLLAVRGALLDRNSNPLAITRYSGIVTFDPSVAPLVPKDKNEAERIHKGLDKAIPLLAGILGWQEAALREKVTEAQQKATRVPGLRYFPIAKNVPIDKAQDIEKNRFALFGFGVVEGAKRMYPTGRENVHLVGFTGTPDAKKTGVADRKSDAEQNAAWKKTNVVLGMAGLERSCNDWLAGKNGTTRSEVSRNNREIPDTRTAYLPAQDGRDVVTSLDINIQHIVVQEAQKAFLKYHPKGVSVVVVEPGTGDILALCSLPNFDPNPGGRKNMTAAEIQAALFDRCTGLVYEPGSTLKSLTVAAALDAGVISPESHFQCSGRLHIGKSSLRCDSHGGSNVHGWVSSGDILRVSCNVGAAQIGLKMGARKLYAAEEKFGLLAPLPIDLPIQQKGFLSLDNSRQLYSPHRAARVAFGHSISTTPVHVAMAYAAMANGGKLMKPRLLLALKDAQGRTIQEWKPEVIRQAISEETSRTMRRMLSEVVTSGTGRVTAMPGYQLAGKTGTAHKYKDHLYVGSFAGFLPASPDVKPRAVILVAIDEPQGAYYGAEVAAPVFAEIARRTMAYWHVPEDDPQSHQYRLARKTLQVAQRH